MAPFGAAIKGARGRRRDPAVGGRLTDIAPPARQTVMHHDVTELQAFYDTSLGQVVRRLVRRRVRALWPDVRGEVVLGLGYATPFLRPFRDEAERVFAVMPAVQGVVPWPSDGRGLAALADETELPLPDYSVDRVLLAHGLETSEVRGRLLDEVWRVLAARGRLLVIVPNRRGLWSRTDRTPFGNGHPYSASQLQRLLRQAHFVPDRIERAVHIPPLRSTFLLTSAPAWEEIGRRWFDGFGGVVMVEASKEVYRVAGRRRRTRNVRPALLPRPVAQPARVGADGPTPVLDGPYSAAAGRSMSRIAIWKS